jgi:hypothetical protein
MQTWAVALSKNASDLLVAANAQEPEPCLPPTKETGGFFIYGFEKNDRTNISDDELEALKDVAEQLLARTGKQLNDATNDGSLTEICHDPKI